MPRKRLSNAANTAPGSVATDAIAQRIRIFREYRELSRAELARLSDCPESDLVAYENGLRPVPAPQLRRIAAALGFGVAVFTPATGGRREPAADDFELERIAYFFAQIESDAERSKLLRTVLHLSEKAGAKIH